MSETPFSVVIEHADGRVTFGPDRADRAGLSEDWRGLLPDCPLVIVLGRSRFFRLDLQKWLVTRKFSYGTVDTAGFA